MKRAGLKILDKTPDGWLVRCTFPGGWHGNIALTPEDLAEFIESAESAAMADPTPKPGARRKK